MNDARGRSFCRGTEAKALRHRARSTIALLVFSCTAAAAHAVPAFDDVRAAHRPSDIPLLDRHDEVIQWQRTDATVRRGPWVALADTSPALREAIVLSEDRRFWAHGGVDWRALADPRARHQRKTTWRESVGGNVGDGVRHGRTILKLRYFGTVPKVLPPRRHAYRGVCYFWRRKHADSSTGPW